MVEENISIDGSIKMYNFFFVVQVLNIGRHLFNKFKQKFFVKLDSKDEIRTQRLHWKIYKIILKIKTGNVKLKTKVGILFSKKITLHSMTSQKHRHAAEAQIFICYFFEILLQQI
jgi:hypothetical protein